MALVIRNIKFLVSNNEIGGLLLKISNYQ